MQEGKRAVDERFPDQVGKVSNFGAENLRFPVGGCAKGIPMNSSVFSRSRI